MQFINNKHKENLEKIEDDALQTFMTKLESKLLVYSAKTFNKSFSRSLIKRKEIIVLMKEKHLLIAFLSKSIQNLS